MMFNSISVHTLNKNTSLAPNNIFKPLIYFRHAFFVWLYTTCIKLIKTTYTSFLLKNLRVQK